MMGRIRLMGLMLALLVLTAAGADINKGYTFTPGEKNVTHTKLNNLVDAASINTSFFTDKTATTAPGANDVLLLYSASAAGFRKVTLNNLVLANGNLILDQTEDTNPATNDWVLSYDVSGSALKKVTWQSLLNSDGLINARTNWLTPNTNTFLLAYDAGTWSKVERQNLFHDFFTTQQFTNLDAAVSLSGSDRFWIESAAESGPRTITLDGVRNYIDASPGTIALTNQLPVTFVSDEADVATGLAVNVAHGLGGVPQQVHAVMVCKTSDLAWAVGDEVSASGFNISNANPAISWGANATNVFVSVESTTLGIRRKDTGVGATITTSSWKLKVYATRFP
jgi:hypothetical protein